MSKYDLPAAIDKVLEITGQKQIYQIGNSQGTLVGFMTMSDHPEYNNKVCASKLHSFQITYDTNH